MVRFAFFVDGSNLFGSLKEMGIEVDDYQSFFTYLFKAAEQQWHTSVNAGQSVATMLQRIYWYQVSSIDSWNLDDAQAQAFLHERFDANTHFKAKYMEAARKTMVGQTQAAVALKAWSLCFAELRDWYDSKKRILDGMRRFHYGVQSSTDLIDILEIGHWKVDFFTQSLEEKGLDTRLAVDMIALEQNYDVAIVVSGDADSIPSIDLMKRRGKHVGAVEFVRGYPPEQKGRSFSSKIKLSADFVSRIYEMDVIGKNVARKAAVKPAQPSRR
jgi:uncharacterized LabA/DUF88 family protein